MKAIMLAAGVGHRLYGDDDSQPPKALLRFEGKSLLNRHVDILKACGIDELTIVVGYRHHDMLAEVTAIGAEGFVRPLFNPDFRRGPVLSLWRAREVLESGAPVVFMDADVLYHPELMARLVGSPHESCFLFDRDFEPGAEPVKLCIRRGAAVDFGKRVSGDFDVIGEWPGFLKLSPAMARRLAAALKVYVDAGDHDAAYEPAMRDALLSAPPGSFGFEDVTGIPWIEIDFPSDLLRAERVILRRIKARPAETGDDSGMSSVAS
jgi:choline kinase